MNKFLGFDKISVCVLKDCFFVILGFFIDIINCFIFISIFLDNWKEVEVILIFKDGDYEKVVNNRLLFLLVVVLKVFERIVLN